MERTGAYVAFHKGEPVADELLGLTDVVPDDPFCARIWLHTEPGANAVSTLIQGCGACHNDVLDQNLTRAGFHIDV